MDLVFQHTHTALSIYDAFTSILVFIKIHSNNLLLDEAMHHPLLLVGTIILKHTAIAKQDHKQRWTQT
jgi:hypothetical protein